MFNRTKIYSVYVKQGTNNPLDSAIFIKQGFNFKAFLFTALWALYNRLWLLALVVGAVSAIFIMNSGAAFMISSILFSIWFGLEANNFKSHQLEKKGYILFDVATGTDRMAAQARFFDKYMLNTPRAYKQDFSTMKPAAS